MTAPAPVRLQLSRVSGSDLQALSRATNGLSAIKVDRSTVWGNSFRVDRPVDRRQVKRWGWWPLGHPDFVAPDAETAVRRFSAVLALDEAIHSHVRTRLGGHNLACWCEAGEPCHADVLLRFCREVSP